MLLFPCFYFLFRVFKGERPFAVLKEHYGLRRMRFYTLERNHVQVLLACCAYNLRRAVTVLKPA